MDPTSLNTLVGIIGIIVGIIGIVTGSIGIYSLKTVKKMKNKMSAKNTNGNVQQAGVINNGASYQDMEYMADKKSSEVVRKFTKVSEIEKLVEEDPRYIIPLLWRGTEKEYEELIKENKIIDNAQYALYEE